MINNLTVESIMRSMVVWMQEVAEELVEEGLISPEEITINTKPGALTTSHILVPNLVRLQEELGIEIPDNCYPFYNYRTHQQLTIKESAEIIIKRARHARQFTAV